MLSYQTQDLKSVANNVKEVTLRLSSYMTDNDKANFSHDSLFKDQHVSKLRKSFEYNSSSKIKLSNNTKV